MLLSRKKENKLLIHIIFNLPYISHTLEHFIYKRNYKFCKSSKLNKLLDTYIYNIPHQIDLDIYTAKRMLKIKKCI